MLEDLQRYTRYQDSPLHGLIQGLRTRLAALSSSLLSSSPEQATLTEAAKTLEYLEAVFTLFSEGAVPGIFTLANHRNQIFHLSRHGMSSLYQLVDLFHNKAFTRRKEAETLAEFFLKYHTAYSSLDHLLSFLNKNRIKEELVNRYSSRLEHDPAVFDTILQEVISRFSDIQNRLIAALQNALFDTSATAFSGDTWPAILETVSVPYQKYLRLKAYLADKDTLIQKIGGNDDDVTTRTMLQNAMGHLENTIHAAIQTIHRVLDQDEKENEERAPHTSSMEHIQFFETRYKKMHTSLVWLDQHAMPDSEAFMRLKTRLQQLAAHYQHQKNTLSAEMAASFDPTHPAAVYAEKRHDLHRSSSSLRQHFKTLREQKQTLHAMQALQESLLSSQMRASRHIPFTELENNWYFVRLRESLALPDQNRLNECEVQQASWFSLLDSLDLFSLFQFRPTEENYGDMWNALSATLADKIQILTEKIAQTASGLKACSLSHLQLSRECDESLHLYRLLTQARKIHHAVLSFTESRPSDAQAKEFLKIQIPELLEAYQLLEEDLSHTDALPQEHASACEKIRELVRDKDRVVSLLKDWSDTYVEHKSGEGAELDLKRQQKTLSKLLRQGLYHPQVTEWLDLQEPVASTHLFDKSTPWGDVQAAIAEKRQISHHALREKTLQIKSRIRQYRQDPAWRALYHAVIEARTYGNRILRDGQKNNDPVREATGREFKQFSKALLDKMHAHISNPDQPLEFFKMDFADALRAEAFQASVHYALWKPVLANLALLLTGIGGLVMACKAIHGYRTGTSLCFFAQTRRERRVEEVLQKTRGLGAALA